VDAGRRCSGRLSLQIHKLIWDRLLRAFELVARHLPAVEGILMTTAESA